MMLALVLCFMTVIGRATCNLEDEFQGWKVVDGRLIGFYTKDVTWAEAQGECERLNATLVIGDTPAVNAHLNTLGKSIAHLNTLGKSIAHLNLLGKSIAHLDTLGKSIASLRPAGPR